MGATQSTPYNPENPRRLSDLPGWEIMLAELTKHQEVQPEDTEFIASFTAPEFQALCTMTMGIAMAEVMFDPKRAEKSEARWKPWVSVLNATDERVSATMWCNGVCETAQPIIIEGGEEGRLALPEKVNFERDYPLNPVLNPREIHFSWDNEEKVYACARLNNGHSRNDVVLQPGRQLAECGEVPKKPQEEPAPDDVAMSLAILDFLAEASDPACPKITQERAEAIGAVLQRIRTDALH